MSYTTNNITTRKFDVVIVGAGGSGMRRRTATKVSGCCVAIEFWVVRLSVPLPLPCAALKETQT